MTSSLSAALPLPGLGSSAYVRSANERCLEEGRAFFSSFSLPLLSSADCFGSDPTSSCAFGSSVAVILQFNDPLWDRRLLKALTKH